MQLQSFSQQLHTLSPELFLEIPRVYILCAQEYPLIITYIQEKFGSYCATKVIDAQEIEWQQFYGMMQMSFLGQSYMYIVLHSDAWSAKEQEAFKRVLLQYQGPHYILVWSIHAWWLQEKIAAVDLDEEMDWFAAKQVTHFLPTTFPFVFAQVLKQAYVHNKKLPLNQIVTVWRYSQVIGKNYEQFSHDWLPKIVDAKESLFTLSQHFFAGNIQEFARMWQKNYTAAKLVSSGLPFSFLKTDWAKQKPELLDQALSDMYVLDYKIKNGMHPHIIFLFPFTVLYHVQNQ
ncbi:hypothetical protein EBR77_03200 [bacterium]|nr:hypothetical protein [bacterium]